MSRQVVLSPFYPISDKLDTSHRAGWGRYWANELSCELFTTSRMAELDELKRGDSVLLYHGMEFKGAMNLQSGLTEELLARVKRVLDAKKRGVLFRSLDIPCARYGRLLAERGMDPTSAEALDKVCAGMPAVGAPKTAPSNLVIGDSHALSLYRPDTVISRADGLTLHGALLRGLTTIVDEFGFQNEVEMTKPKVMTFYFGNIDIRHHLARYDAFVTKELVDEYGHQLVAITKGYKPKVLEVVLPLPIEDESRPIPKSGWYKGSAFFGDWSQRHQLRLEMRDRLKRMAKKHGFQVYEHPRHFIQKDGKLSFDVMEKPRSVHIRPSEYRLVQEGLAWRV